MLIQILVIENCLHEEPAVRLVSSVAALLGVTPIVELVEVRDLDRAAAVGFVGSPTIRVNGQDVAPVPTAGLVHAPSLACRIYDTSEGRRGVPDERLVREAMAAAMVTELAG